MIDTGESKDCQKIVNSTVEFSPETSERGGPAQILLKSKATHLGRWLSNEAIQSSFHSNRVLDCMDEFDAYGLLEPPAPVGNRR
jgi:hypothetical protein